MAVKTKLPAEFEQKLFELINDLICVDGLRFNIYVPGIKLYQEIASDDDIDQMVKDYSIEYWACDPMHPSNFEHTERLVVTNSEMMTDFAWQKTEIFKNFFSPHGIFHNADVFFRQQDKIIAVLTLLRSDPSQRFNAKEVGLLNSIQPFIQFSLQNIYLPKRTHDRESMSNEFGLTAREVDVLELALTGASNKILVDQLKISLPTLRTHLQNIYTKTGVHSLSELIFKVMSLLGTK
jgi:DNA-binding CsgD family transcriptional regulator